MRLVLRVFSHAHDKSAIPCLPSMHNVDALKNEIKRPEVQAWADHQVRTPKCLETFNVLGCHTSPGRDVVSHDIDARHIFLRRRCLR
eukprot:3932985-Rhodomonas_salina.2